MINWGDIFWIRISRKLSWRNVVKLFSDGCHSRLTACVHHLILPLLHLQRCKKVEMKYKRDHPSGFGITRNLSLALIRHQSTKRDNTLLGWKLGFRFNYLLRTSYTQRLISTWIINKPEAVRSEYGNPRHEYLGLIKATLIFLVSSFDTDLLL